MGEPSGTPGRVSHRELAPHLDRAGSPSGVGTSTGRPSASSRKSSQWWAALRLVPADVDLHRDGRGDRIRTGHAPPATEDVELAVGHLGGVTEHHRYLHAAPRLLGSPGGPRRSVRHRPGARGCHGSVNHGMLAACGTTSTGGPWPPPSTAWASARAGRCVDVGAGGGDVSVALAEIVGRDGRVYAVDSDPTARDEVAEAAAAHSQVLAITQAGEDLRLPEPVDLAFCRFLLLHVVDPAVVLARMAAAVRPGGWVVAQEPITSAGRDRRPPASRCPTPAIPTSAPCSPSLVRDAGLSIVDAWAEAPAGAGPGPVADYLATAHRGRPRGRPGRAAPARDTVDRPAAPAD